MEQADRAKPISPSMEDETLYTLQPSEKYISPLQNRPQNIPQQNIMPQQRLIPQFQIQTRTQPKPQTISQMFRPVIPAKKVQASQKTMQAVQSGPADIVALIKKYFPKNQWNNAMAVMNQESGGRNIPSQFNKYGTEESYGPFQINLQAHPQMRGKVNIPEENVKYAAQLFNQSQWQPWFNSARKLGLL